VYKDQHKWIQLALMFVDSVLSLLAILLAGLLRYGTMQRFAGTVDFVELIIIALLSNFTAFIISKMYGDFFKRGYLRELQHVTLYSLLVLLFVTLYSFATKNSMALSRLTLLYFSVVSVLLIYGVHLLIKTISASKARGKYGWKLMIIADAQSAAEICLNVSKNELNDRAVGVMILDKQTIDPAVLSGIPFIDPSVGCMDYITHHTVDEVLFSISESHYQEDGVQALLKDIAKTGVVLSLKVRFPIRNEPKDEPYVSRLLKFGDTYILSFANREYDYSMILIKRLMDIVGGVIGLVITAVVSPFLAAAILLESPGPLFFRQKRVGRNGRIFSMAKFRSMVANAEQGKAALLEKNEMKGPLFKLKDDPRVTRVGNFLRKTSLDELPQFWNILKGDMSVVGTRPPTLDEYAQYTGAQKKRLSFRPGLTGMWQVSGRSNIADFDDVMKLDLQYIQEWSIYLDVKLILKTILAVLFGRGAE
jgi:exopolysaccharide biosynthesis polyprenyl glycosylphosphotransferase